MQITGAESRIMEALWARGSLAADEIIAAVAGPEGWGEATVKTLINRLLKKKAIQSVRAEGRHRYQALLRREDYVQAESQGLLDRLFGGQLAPLVSHFAEQRALSPEDVARLKKLIEDLDDGG
jgi:predicted transcriptional regulator